MAGGQQIHNKIHFIFQNIYYIVESTQCVRCSFTWNERRTAFVRRERNLGKCRCRCQTIRRGSNVLSNWKNVYLTVPLSWWTDRQHQAHCRSTTRESSPFLECDETRGRRLAPPTARGRRKAWRPVPVPYTSSPHGVSQIARLSQSSNMYILIYILFKHKTRRRISSDCFSDE